MKTAAMRNTVRKEGKKNNSWLASIPETQFCYLCFSPEGSQYKRCDFEEGFCDMTQSPETTSGWFRTNQVPGLQHDHAGRNSGEPLKCDVWIQKHRLLSCPRLSPSAHFLSLLPVRGNRTAADLKSPVFLPTRTCQVTKSSPGLTAKNRVQALTCIVCLHLKLSFYHHVGAQHGRLHVIVQHYGLDRHTEVWKNSTQAREDVWWQTTIWIPSDHTFQVQFARKSPTPNVGRPPPYM